MTRSTQHALETKLPDPDQAVLDTLRRRILVATQQSREGHVPSALSILDILWVLYDRVLRHDPANPTWDERDRFVLSKGHGSLGLYAVLSEKGYFPPAEMETFATFESRLGGHPDSNKVPGVEASTGSLGHGMPMAVGMALGLRIRGVRRRVYTLVGDGECNEGSIWEAAMLAAHHHLSGLTCIVDHNHSTDRALDVGDLVAKFAAFGWEACEVDGHDHGALERSLRAVHPDRPSVVVARCVKGRGVPGMESNPAWHHRTPTPEELSSLLAGLQ